MKILHLEDNPSDALIIERGIQRQGIQAAFIQVRSPSEYSEALKAGGFDVVLVDNNLPGYSAEDAIVEAKASYPEVPVIVCSGAALDAEVAASFAAGANDYVLKDHLWQLSAALRRNIKSPAPVVAPPQAAMMLLVDVVQKLSLARGIDAIVDIVRKAARQLTGCDGATFVLRDGPFCYYVDEDAISPLWKGQRFPLETCISGWAMLNSQSAVIPDIYKDSRIPHAAYRPTFVHSLAMVPIRSYAPIGAIGNYWANHHECTPQELMLLEALANTTAVAMENVEVYQNLERQVRERTRELQTVNQELEAFSSAVSHDLRAPLRIMNAELDMAREHAGVLPAASVVRLRDSTTRMGSLIDDLLRLSHITRTELYLQQTDLSEIANKIVTRLRNAEPQRDVEICIEPGLVATADAGLMSVVLENLLSNAWKYSSKRERSRIELSSYRDSADGIVYRVQDNGAGFNPNQADRLFKPFTRLHDARQFPGVGIGLATVQRIIQRHGGEIWATSDGNTGAQFMFTLGEQT
ncbi:ATP-binding protein [Steroidobacter flavus]|uniref:histidine kinase n=1 Tax=Steroidobacter flavus TaxID=1842136 RepID=A0ABV8SV32_9GAMM